MGLYKVLLCGQVLLTGLSNTSISSPSSSCPLLSRLKPSLRSWQYLSVTRLLATLSLQGAGIVLFIIFTVRPHSGRIFFSNYYSATNHRGDTTTDATTTDATTATTDTTTATTATTATTFNTSAGSAAADSDTGPGSALTADFDTGSAAGR